MKLLRRIVRFRIHLDKIFDIKLPILVTMVLLRQPCLLKRFCQPCNKCFERARFGREILTELIGQIDNPFGISILEKHCSSPDKDSNIYALLTGLISLCMVDHRNRFIQKRDPIKNVLDRVSEILLNESVVRLSYLNIINFFL